MKYLRTQKHRVWCVWCATQAVLTVSDSSCEQQYGSEGGGIRGLLQEAESRLQLRLCWRVWGKTQSILRLTLVLHPHHYCSLGLCRHQTLITPHCFFSSKGPEAGWCGSVENTRPQPGEQAQEPLQQRASLWVSSYRRTIIKCTLVLSEALMVLRQDLACDKGIFFLKGVCWYNVKT